MGLWRRSSETNRGLGLSLRDFLQDLVSVVLGVLIALAVDEWRDDRRKATEARASLTELRRELEANRAIIQRRQPLHRQLDSLLGALLNSSFEKEQIGRKQVLRQWFTIAPNGFGSASGSQLAWQLALQSRSVEQFDAPTRLLLARVYDEDAQLLAVSERTLQNLFQTPATEVGNVFGSVLSAKGTLGDVVAGEQRLSELYPRALARVDSLLAR